MSVDRSRLKSTFFELVRIDSLTFNEQAVIEYLQKQLTGIGLETRIDDAGAKIGGATGNLVAHIPGDPNVPAIFFNCHVDTVEPGSDIRPVEANGIITAAGDTILGADDKVGAAVLLELARAVTAGHAGHGPIDLIFTVAEEKGLLGAKNLDWDLVTARSGFVIDAAGPVGDVTVSAPFQDTIEAIFHGKAAHAGVNPEQGVSAIRAAARAVETMSLGRIDHETTANIGLIEGGRATNIVAEKAVIKGEARSLVADKLAQQTESMIKAAKAAADSCGCQVEIDAKREYEGFRLAKDDQTVAWAVSAFDSIGVKASLVATGGGSDTNVFNSRGVPTVNLGAGYRAPHTTQESVSVEELERAARVAVAIVGKVAGR